MKTWESPLGALELNRWPVREEEAQAWDGADTYLLEELRDRGLLEGPVLVLGDTWGALAVALASGGTEATVWSDSEVTRRALAVNAERAGVQVGYVPSTEVPPPAAAVVGRLPKSLPRLEWMLARLDLEAGTPVLLGDKSKKVQKSHVALAEEALGAAESTRARHRARLVAARVMEDRVTGAVEPLAHSVEGAQVRGWPGVFGAAELDGGTRALLDAMGAPKGAVLDLGCGAGTLGLVARARGLAEQVTFADASYAAVASARLGWTANGWDEGAAFVATDVLDGVEDASADVVLCNPPFHAQGERTRRIAAHMISESHRVLRPGGRLLLVGNRHLGYLPGVKRRFGAAEAIGGDRRFVVVEGVRA